MIKDDERYWANMVIDVIDKLEYPLLMYEGEKMIVRKALKAYLEANDRKTEPQIEPNLILPERMERGEMYEVGDSIVVMNSEDYYDLLCKSWEKTEPQAEGILFKGNLKEGEYKLIKTTDGWVLEGEDIVYCGWERGKE